MKTLWLKLGPKYQRWVVVVGTITVGWLFASFFASDPPKIKSLANSKQKNTRYIFTDRTSHET